MFLGAYHFDGDPDVLEIAYRALLQVFPPDTLQLHVCVSTDAGLTVYDACPSRADFEAFSTGHEFAAAIAGAGLPAPRPVAIGEIRNAVVNQAVTR